MTTTVTVKACCAPDIEVVVTIEDNWKVVEIITLQNGEGTEKYVYGNRAISVREVTKGE
jgi:hypothetical protein